MIDAIVLDSSPLGNLSNPGTSPVSTACKRWLQQLLAAQVTVFLPEIADYEVRRELLRGGKKRALALLDHLALTLQYLPLNTATMRFAAELWAQSRQRGYASAGDQELDGDVIVVAQALALGRKNVIIAMTNVRHIGRFVRADLWENIKP